MGFGFPQLVDKASKKEKAEEKVNPQPSTLN